MEKLVLVKGDHSDRRHASSGRRGRGSPSAMAISQGDMVTSDSQGRYNARLAGPCLLASHLDAARESRLITNRSASPWAEPVEVVARARVRAASHRAGRHAKTRTGTLIDEQVARSPAPGSREFAAIALWLRGRRTHAANSRCSFPRSWRWIRTRSGSAAAFAVAAKPTIVKYEPLHFAVRSDGERRKTPRSLKPNRAHQGGTTGRQRRTTASRPSRPHRHRHRRLNLQSLAAATESKPAPAVRRRPAKFPTAKESRSPARRS